MSDDTVAETQAAAGSPRETLAVGTKIGKYTLVRVLGAGGMGIVWAAHDPDLDREIAIKLLRASGPTEHQRFLREARAMARLKHPNVLTVYEAGTHDGRDYIAMELVEGCSFASWLETPRPRDTVWNALVAAGRGLSAAHEAGLVHRDFKPHNVLIRTDGRVLVTDFGLARAVGDESVVEPAPTPAADLAAPIGGTDPTVAVTPRSSSDGKLTQTGTLVGTPAYMAPEQFTGTLSDPRTDQFAFCITAWHALTGKRPYRGDSADELARAVTRPPDLSAELAREVRTVIGRGLAVAPEQRYPTMAALLEALDRARRAPRRRRIALAIVSGLVIATAIAIVVWHLRPAPEWAADVRRIGPAIEENSDVPAISPDGKRIAYPAAETDSPWRIYVVDLADDGKPPTVVSADDCGWSPRWIDDSELVYGCAPDQGLESDTRLVRQRIGEPARPIGPGMVGEPCGSRLLVVVETVDKQRYLAERSPDGHDTRLITGDVFHVRCEPTGGRFAYTEDPRTGFDTKVLRLVGGGGSSELARGDIADFAFTPGGKSLVIAKGVGASYDLFELVLADGSEHRLTTGADARAVDVSRDGSVVVYNRDVTSIPLYEFDLGSGKSTQRTSLVEELFRPAPVPGGNLVLVERVAEVGSMIVVIDLATRARYDLVAGNAPFPSRDGSRVYYTSIDDPHRLEWVPIKGGPPTVVATFPDTVVDGVDAEDGVHVEIGSRVRGIKRKRNAPTHGWRIAADGTRVDDQVDGLVFPSPSGWRAVRLDTATGEMIRVVAPGKPLGEPTYPDRANNGRPVWVSDFVLGYCDLERCYLHDVQTNAVVPTAKIDADPRSPYAMHGGGTRALGTRNNGQVTRHKIVNFADRPWKP